MRGFEEHKDFNAEKSKVREYSRSAIPKLCLHGKSCVMQSNMKKTPSKNSIRHNSLLFLTGFCMPIKAHQALCMLGTHIKK
jgi:hypothetical protein